MVQPITNLFTNMKIDYWYKALIVIGATLFILNGSGWLERYPMIPTAFISGGIFFIGLGEWVNHPVQIRFISSVHFAKSHPRRFTTIGTILDIVGFTSVIVGVMKLF
ncbi:hypothetical protein ACSIZT_004402 [Yersinia enterocolitica]|nr:hypothetical protein B4907_20595 [Yersinia kristensenii]HEI6740068.1 hypothetical protein [Yersinia enterocolitica]